MSLTYSLQSASSVCKRADIPKCPCRVKESSECIQEQSQVYHLSIAHHEQFQKAQQSARSWPCQLNENKNVRFQLRILSNRQSAVCATHLFSPQSVRCLSLKLFEPFNIEPCTNQWPFYTYVTDPPCPLSAILLLL